MKIHVIGNISKKKNQNETRFFITSNQNDNNFSNLKT
jgi:hypothetical protein